MQYSKSRVAKTRQNLWILEKNLLEFLLWGMQVEWFVPHKILHKQPNWQKEELSLLEPEESIKNKI
jgi:hypothetical protein